MPVIEKYLKVKTFALQDGTPTCATDVMNGEFCMFLGTSGMGTRDECLATGTRISRVGRGFTVPVNNCPMRDAVTNEELGLDREY